MTEATQVTDAARSNALETLGEALPVDCGVCVINLDHRADRWREFEETMLRHLRPKAVHRISAVEGIKLAGFGEPPLFRGRARDRTWAARAGCTLSHRAALTHARECGWGGVLVLEDDVHVPQPLDAPTLEALRTFLANQRRDLCYFGFTDPVPPFRKLASLGGAHDAHQVFGCNTAHAYLCGKRAIDHLLDLLPAPADIWGWLSRHRAVDRFYYRNASPALEVTAVSPVLIDQRAGFSDIIGREVDACADAYETRIEPLDPEPDAFHRDLAAKAAAFRRAGWIDRCRGRWKLWRGF